MSVSADITIKHNEDFTLDFQVQDGSGNAVEDLTGAVAQLQIRGKALDENPLVSVNGFITPADGSIQFTVPDSIMLTLLDDGDMRRSLVYGTLITYSDGLKEEPVSGRIKLLRGVVR